MMDKFGHEPLHYPDEVQPDKHKRDRDSKDETDDTSDGPPAAADDEEQHPHPS